ncbi:MAG: rhodanese-like domain-containing protein [Gammaproteobacteria bacterium]|nr:rhodanese-like domain-containing protein [Gammaproteobacteria bacterium]
MRSRICVPAGAAALAIAFSFNALADDLTVGITRSMDKFEGVINGKPITIMRNQDQTATVNPAFAKTSRKCPPFCIQPFTLAPGVETIGEVELIGYIERMANGDDSILLIDSRTPDWVSKGTIPGAVNIPWTRLNPARGADPISIGEIMTGDFGARELEGLWDFSSAKTLVLFCNGNWCGQSPNNIRNLMRFGYPADKLKWYRGGMQDWEILGLTTVKP